jgi:hypothetical protein
MPSRSEARDWCQGEGRKSHAEARPEIVAEAKRLRRPKGGQLSYRQIAGELFQAGYCNSNGANLKAFCQR